MATFGAYPRACGGTALDARSAEQVTGLSPRVRGNHLGVPQGKRIPGPIPARAGEPTKGDRIACPQGAYPRACGGTWLRVLRHPWHQGLSPRVRGNL